MGLIKQLLSVCLVLGWSSWAEATPKIEYWELENGVGVYFVSSHDLPIVQIKLVVDAGSARDPRDMKGLASMTAGMLEEGTRKRNAQEIATAFESLGVEFGAAANQDMAVLGIRSLSDTRYLAPAMDVFKEVLMQPSFPGPSLEREKQRTLVALKQREQSPGDIADRTFNRLVYGDHPYASEPIGDAASVRAMTPEALEKFYRQFYIGSNTKMTIVGDLTTGKAKQLAVTLAGDLPKGEKAPAIPPVEMPKKAIQRHISFPSTQSHIQVGQPGVIRNDPDYFPLFVGNYILGGGGLVSRLAEEIREKQGLAYSVYSYFSPLKERGPFTMGMQTRESQRDKALSLLQKELRQFIDKGPTETELVAAKKHLTGGFPLRIDSNKSISGYLTVIGFYDLPLTYLDEFNDRIEAVTVEQIKDAFRRRLQPDKMVIVTVGDGRK